MEHITSSTLRQISFFNPPRATEHHGWFGRRQIKLFLRKAKVAKKEEELEGYHRRHPPMHLLPSFSPNLGPHWKPNLEPNYRQYGRLRWLT
ncbi:hypothetical protein FH972_015114 [Carpinus fangiana]|uniref:Uncharacterized protein n=1 Tax=Carpinus fangiana TaxID=176857 RepID=A0A5N6REZ6_9ROSI|nr:hypothetical protein FH972_015114 [Carpinus fangiana]